ncbi:hypothetical protein vseg_015778 [Gypsophila vaccaria]
MGMRRLIVESDSKVVVDLITSRRFGNTTYGPLVRECSRLLSVGEHFALRHVHREANVNADKMSKLTLSFPLGVHELYAPSHGIQTSMTHDIQGFSPSPYTFM